MNTEQLEQIIDRYLAGKATPAEKALLQRWFEETDKEQVSLSFSKQQQISRDLWQRIQQPDMRTGVMQLFSIRLLKYAAAVIALVVATAGLLFEKNVRALFSSHTIAYERVMTAPGKIKMVQLPDNSVIHLFPNSKISIPENYGVKDRLVLLEGKAFFEIRDNPDKLFRVQANQLVTTVLGTSFEVSAFATASQNQVAVATGKVSVAYGDRWLGELSARKKLSLDLSTGVVTTATSEIAGSWRDGQLKFQQTPLPDVCNQLNEWFDVHITIDNPERLKEQVTVNFKGEPLEKILIILSKTSGFTYTIDHRNIHIH